MLPGKRYLAPDLADFFGGFGKLVNFEDDWALSPKIEIDVEDKLECYEIKANLPEVKKEDVSVNLEGNTLTISVLKTQQKEETGKAFLVRERRQGYSSRSLVLPAEVGHDDVSATLKDGVLYISVRKQVEKQNKKIQIA